MVNQFILNAMFKVNTSELIQTINSTLASEKTNRTEFADQLVDSYIDYIKTLKENDSLFMANGLTGLLIESVFQEPVFHDRLLDVFTTIADLKLRIKEGQNGLLRIAGILANSGSDLDVFKGTILFDIFEKEGYIKKPIVINKLTDIISYTEFSRQQFLDGRDIIEYKALSDALNSFNFSSVDERDLRENMGFSFSRALLKISDGPYSLEPFISNLTAFLSNLDSSDIRGYGRLFNEVKHYIRDKDEMDQSLANVMLAGHVFSLWSDGNEFPVKDEDLFFKSIGFAMKQTNWLDLERTHLALNVFLEFDFKDKDRAGKLFSNLFKRGLDELNNGKIPEESFDRYSRFYLDSFLAAFEKFGPVYLEGFVDPLLGRYKDLTLKDIDEMAYPEVRRIKKGIKALNKHSVEHPFLKGFYSQIESVSEEGLKSFLSTSDTSFVQAVLAASPMYIKDTKGLRDYYLKILKVSAKGLCSFYGNDSISQELMIDMFRFDPSLANDLMGFLPKDYRETKQVLRGFSCGIETIDEAVKLALDTQLESSEAIKGEDLAVSGFMSCIKAIASGADSELVFSKFSEKAEIDMVGDSWGEGYQSNNGRIDFNLIWEFFKKSVDRENVSSAKAHNIMVESACLGLGRFFLSDDFKKDNAEQISQFIQANEDVYLFDVIKKAKRSSVNDSLGLFIKNVYLQNWPGLGFSWAKASDQPISDQSVTLMHAVDEMICLLAGKRGGESFGEFRMLEELASQSSLPSSDREKLFSETPAERFRFEYESFLDNLSDEEVFSSLAQEVFFNQDRSGPNFLNKMTFILNKVFLNEGTEIHSFDFSNYLLGRINRSGLEVILKMAENHYNNLASTVSSDAVLAISSLDKKALSEVLSKLDNYGAANFERMSTNILESMMELGDDSEKDRVRAIIKTFKNLDLVSNIELTSYPRLSSLLEEIEVNDYKSDIVSELKELSMDLKGGEL